MKEKMKLMAAVLAVTVVITFGVVALAAAGDSSDPLVTLSYLNDVFTPTVTTKIDEALAKNEMQLREKLNSVIDQWDQRLQSQQGAQGGMDNAVFKVITLSKGQTLTGSAGCELMLRVGSATFLTADDAVLIDCTDGSMLFGGSDLVQNHLYMVAAETGTVSAKADIVKLMVCGSYTVS